MNEEEADAFCIYIQTKNCFVVSKERTNNGWIFEVINNDNIDVMKELIAYEQKLGTLHR